MAARTRAAVLDAALFCFAENGWDGTTLDQIGQRAGLTRGAVCHHFRDKRSLLRSVLDEGWADQSRVVLAPLMDETVEPSQRVVGFVAEYLIRLKADPSLRALATVTSLLAPHARNDPEGLDEHRLGMDVWREHLRRVLRRCALRPDVVVEQALFGLLSVMLGMTLEAATDPSRLPDRAGARVMGEASVRGWITGLER